MHGKKDKCVEEIHSTKISNSKINMILLTYTVLKNLRPFVGFCVVLHLKIFREHKRTYVKIQFWDNSEKQFIAAVIAQTTSLELRAKSFSEKIEFHSLIQEFCQIGGCFTVLKRS